MTFGQENFTWKGGDRGKRRFPAGNCCATWKIGIEVIMNNEDRLKTINSFLENECFPLLRSKGHDYTQGNAKEKEFGNSVSMSSIYEYDTIEAASRARADEATAAGKSPEPWEDADRDFIEEALEELADARNYVVWAMRREVPPDAAFTLLCIRQEIANTFYRLLEAKREIDKADLGTCTRYVSPNPYNK